MHYLKCNNCGHLNEVNGEYLTFCSKCNKKLENNFSDWKKRNPEKSLEDFKQLICISASDIQNSKLRTKAKPKGLKYWIGFSVAFAVFYAIGQFGGEAIVKYFKSDMTSNEILSIEWTKATYGDYGLTVETPFKLTKETMQIPENVREFIEQIDVYASNEDEGFKVMLNSIKYFPVVGQADLQGAANGSINEMSMQKDVTDFAYTEEYIYLDDFPGFVQNGTFKHNGVEIAFINAGFAKGLNLWQVMVSYWGDDEIGRKAAKRVIDSIAIIEK